ncbi:MAG TPA: dolichyl-phosphate beta-glucosyltransferase [Methylomirabilota bacterium]|nr:dolichyl-phosphate beta-glucosyltransferase [Methylomirabilota bacterium]
MGFPRVEWSVIIPAYNEALRLPAYLKDVVAYFEGRDVAFEVLVVDDGSTDDTAERVAEIAAGRPFIGVHVLPGNRGKGAAVREGMRRTQGALKLMTDADGATPIGEVERLEAAIRRGADVAVGSRVLRDPTVVRHTRLHRKLSGHVFNFIVRRLGVSGVVDTQCGFKLFRSAVAEDLFGALSTDGFGFDVELVLLAQGRGYRVVEVPISWADQPGSKVGVLSDGPRMLRDIVAARWRLARCGALRRAR